MTGRYKAYPEYKESGVDWLGEVPNHWRLVPLRAVLVFRNEKNSPEKTSNILSLSIAKGVTEYSECEGKSGNKRKDDLTAYKLAYPNDIVMNSMNIIVGAVGISRYFGAISPVYYALYAKDKTALITYYGSIFHNAGFQRGLLKFGKGILIKQSDSGKLNTIRMKVSQDDLKTMYFPKPPIEEQQKIANFLGHETAKIDTLITKQEKLIELLKEKRQAVISHAVTKGLNPEAPMKDSGVEWLGEVPEHWVIKSYRYACKIYRGKFGHRPRNDPAFYDGEYPFIQTGDVARAGKYIKDYKQTLNEKGVGVSQKFPVGTLMMAIAANIGDTAILGFEAYAPDSVVGFKPKADIDLEFLRYSFMAALPALEQTSTQSTQANLNVDRIGAVQASFPSVSEQKEIVAYLDSLLEQYDDIELKSHKSIELMNERKTALISAAVTGKIDVRDWQEPTKQQG
ncbi:TPA: restriction endonuclease subunit S [Vibrio vulnificus]|nr:restriction endonuclease subunit S [Vibrio vulnificus]HCG9629021.1 restriction endonuclease subunit S [Vibrio parahaemolyticus]HDY7597220.1 restriction endonuclease subunit S [Vibrio vulnificus]